MSNEVTQHQVQGVCEVMQMRNDWVEYQVDIGKNYPVKLSTKQPAVKEAAQAAVNAKAIAVWTYSERDGNANPHKPGEFFKNRYLESVVIGGTLDPALSSGQQTHQDAPDGAGAGGGRMPSTEGREISIERQSIIKAALAGVPPFADLDAFFAFLDRIDDWMGRVRTKPDTPEQSSEPVNDGQHLDGQDDPDDIPF